MPPEPLPSVRVIEVTTHKKCQNATSMEWMHPCDFSSGLCFFITKYTQCFSCLLRSSLFFHFHCATWFFRFLSTSPIPFPFLLCPCFCIHLIKLSGKYFHKEIFAHCKILVRPNDFAVSFCAFCCNPQCFEWINLLHAFGNVCLFIDYPLMVYLLLLLSVQMEMNEWFSQLFAW